MPALTGLYRSSVEGLNAGAGEEKRQGQLSEQEGALDASIEDAQKELRELERDAVEREAVAWVEGAWLARLGG